MPRRVSHAVRWLSQRQCYVLQCGADPAGQVVLPGDAAWLDWLDQIASFSFQGRSGNYCTVRRETLRRGGAYWYAYRSLQGRTVKRYLGRTADLTIARLEEVADRIAAASSASPRTAAGVSEGLIAGGSRATNPGRPSAQPASLLASKLHPPRLPGALVRRLRLVDRLDTGRLCKLTLVAAPAGFGKTTLVRQWIEGSAPASLPAWVSLDAGDDDPMLFWRYVITACQALQSGLGTWALAQLSGAMQSPFEPPSLEAVLTPFLNDLAHLAREGLLILDDFHLITAPRIHETFTFFVDHLPSTLHLVLLTRHEPPLPLPRWRARAELAELHATDLRFSLEETTAFFRHTLPFALPETAIAQLDARLDGWAVGLRLLALTMQGLPAPRDVERYLAGLHEGPDAAQPHRAILDYFLTEVLQKQPEPLQLFLLQTSVLDRLTGSLCDELTGRHDSAALLEAMERAGLFLESLDDAGRWYRYHALFADAMRATARLRLGDDALRALSLQASHWYERQGLPAEAIDAALQGGDAERAASLIERLADASNLRFDQVHPLRRWLESIPDEIRWARPRLCLAHAVAIVTTQLPIAPAPALMARVHEELRRADDGWRAAGDLAGRGEVWTFRATLAWREGQIAQAARDARQALAWLADGEDRSTDGAGALPALLEWHAIITAILGNEALESGDMGEALRLLHEVNRRSIATDNRPFVRLSRLLLATAHVALGELHQAEVYYRQVLPDARDQDDQEDLVFIGIGLAELCYEWNDLDATERLVGEARDRGILPGLPELEEHLAFRQALVLHARGHTGAALQQLTGILARLQAISSPRAVQALPIVRSWQGRLQLLAGDLFAAQRGFEDLGRVEENDSPSSRAMVQILAARVLLSQGQHQGALSRLETLLTLAQEQRRVRQALEIRVLKSLALAACRRGPEARQELHLVLAQCCGEGFMRLFLDEGPSLAALLRSLLPSLHGPALRSYARSILQAFGAVPEAPAMAAADTLPIEPLSTQEERVLRLLAAGRSNPEIAGELFVSVNTVKGHVKSLYRKLNVRHRLEAADAARRIAQR